MKNKTKAVPATRNCVISDIHRYNNGHMGGEMDTTHSADISSLETEVSKAKSVVLTCKTYGSHQCYGLFDFETQHGHMNHKPNTESHSLYNLRKINSRNLNNIIGVFTNNLLFNFMCIPYIICTTD